MYQVNIAKSHFHVDFDQYILGIYYGVLHEILTHLKPSTEPWFELCVTFEG